MTFRLTAPRLRSGRLRHILLSSAVLAIAAVPAASHAQAGASATQARAGELRFDVPPQELDSALTRVADQGGIRIFFTSAELAGIRSGGVSGTMTVEQALSQVLTGTGFGWRYREARTVVIERLPDTRGAMQLGPVRVEGAVDTEQNLGSSITSDPAATEGKRSYKAEVASLGKEVVPLRQIPQSVSVLTRQQIDDQNFVTVDQALRQITGVTLGSLSSGGFGVGVRGYELQLQVDGMRSFASPSDAFDLEMYDRIEIQRGPAGVLQGTGSPGGTVNLSRKRPLDHLAISGNVMLGSWENYRAALDVSSPLNASGSLRVRGVISWQDRHYFYDTAYDRHLLGYGILEYDVTPNTTISISGNAQKHRGKPFAGGLPTYTDGSFIDLPRSRSFIAPFAKTDYQFYEGLAEIRHSFGGGWNAKVMYRYRKSVSHTVESYAAGAVDPADNLTNILLSNIPGTSREQGLDVNVGGPFTLFGREHSLLIGYNRESNRAIGRMGFGDIPDINVFDPRVDEITATPEEAAPYFYGWDNYTVQSGFYGNVRLRVLEPLTLVLGGRTTSYHPKSRGSFPSEVGDWSEGTNSASNRFSPYAGVVVDLGSKLSLYGSYSDIFTPQSEMTYLKEILPPRIGWQAEIGAKASLFNGGLYATLAVFRIRDTNRAMVDPDPTHIGCGDFDPCYIAAGLVQSQGIEAELAGSPVPGWQLTLGYTYNETEFLTDANPDNVGRPFSTNTPRHLLKLWTTYRAPNGPLSRWTIGGGILAQSLMYSSNPRIEQKAYAILSAQLGYQITKNVDATLSVTNVLDHKYYQAISSPYNYNMYGEPRAAMLAVRASF